MRLRHEITHFEIMRTYLSRVFKTDIYEKMVKHDSNKGLITVKHITSLISSILQEKTLVRLKQNPNWDYWIKTLSITYGFYQISPKIFRFDNNLTEMLIRTDLYDVSASLIKLPFEIIYITVPRHLFPIELPDEKPQYVEGIYVIDSTPPPDAGYSEQYRLLNVSAVLQPIDEKLCNTEFGVTPEYSIQTLGLPFLDDKDIFTQMRNFCILDIGKRDIMMERLFSFVINAILYLNSDKAIIELIESEFADTSTLRSQRKKQKMEKQNRNLSKIPHYYVGRFIAIDNKFKEIIKKEQAEGTRQCHSQWIVRGHWRNQVCGPNLSERKLIWIQPYFKGNPEKEIINKEYTVK